MTTPKFPTIVVVVTEKDSDWDLIKKVDKQMQVNHVFYDDRRQFLVEACDVDTNDKTAMAKVVGRWVTLVDEHPVR